MSKVVIFGTSNFSTCLCQTLKVEGIHDVISYTVTNDFLCDKELDGIPIVAFESLDDIFDMSECEIALAIGYSEMNGLRKRIYFKCKQRGYKIFTYLSPHTLIYNQNIGEGSLIYPGVYIGPYVRIGKCVVLQMNACITHHIFIGDFSFIAAGSTLGGDVNVGNNCFIGLNSTIRNGISIGSQVLVGAHCFVNKSLNDGVVVKRNQPLIIEGDSLAISNNI